MLLDQPDTIEEVSLIRQLQSRLQATGRVDDVIPEMVQWNVPCFALRQLWPEAWADFVREPRPIAFAIAEQGWRGRIENLNSSLKRAHEGYFLHFEKSYVMSCELVVVVARFEDRLALTRVLRSGEQDWVSRDQESVRFRRTDGSVVDHFRVRGDVQLEKRDVRTLTLAEYRRTGLQIPMRELTSLALLSFAMLRFHNRARADAREDDLVAARAAPALRKEHLLLAREVLADFFKQSEDLTLHSFWDEVRRMAGQT
ncbi:MAG: hypothetical protein H7A21_02210 [Spirochaetales bacterium]|nr:hypothetical protein [Leptospiraceae bacterium]MCP5480221.1 hypothetical protein [Spirochaetales bacterium]MCP5486380.1 hypothetical protein [Spirochaetales bacterium]